MRASALFLYRFAVSLWVGGAALFTFVLTPLIFRNEPRDAAGRIVGYLFPAYFRWGIGCGLLALLALLAVRPRRLKSSIALLVIMINLTLFQAAYVEPESARLKREIGSFETTAKEHPLRREFSRLHGISAVCNLAVLAGGVALLALPCGCRREDG